MSVPKFSRRTVITGALVLLLFCVLTVFNVILSGIQYDAAAFHAPKKKALDIPSDLNFVDDDKKAFLEYCRGLYGGGVPYQVDTLSYCYYGTVGGRRLYRFNATYIPYEPVYNEAEIGGYWFSSPVLYRPYALGLYVVDGRRVLPLQQAYQNGLIDIRKAYELYVSYGGKS